LLSQRFALGMRQCAEASIRGFPLDCNFFEPCAACVNLRPGIIRARNILHLLSIH